jgi:SAM-dependent methyltransferase
VNARQEPGAGHWDQVYASKSPEEVSWFQASPTVSLELIRRSAAPPASVLDVGAGTSFLVDHLLDAGFRPGVIDISAEPLAVVQARLGPRAADVEWHVGDVTRFEPPHAWDVWHDRAVFHFLVDAAARRAYREVLLRSTRAGSTVIVATFGPAGPQRCSGLTVVRYAPEQLAGELGGGFLLEDATWEEHRTPTGVAQQFVYCRFRREPPAP